MTTLYFVRHAQALPKREQGEPEWALSKRGEKQAREIVPVLTSLKIHRLYCSPFRRCRDTLAPFSAAAGLEVVIDEGLRERRIAPAWVGDFRDVWLRSWEDFSFRLEGGESSWTVRQRIAGAVEGIIARHPGETIAIGSHGNSIGLFLNYADAAFGVAEASAMRTPEISRVTHDGTRFVRDRSFSAGPAFDAIATDFRETPNIVA